MFDITAGHEGYQLVTGDALDGAEVIEFHDLDLAPYAEPILTDEQLLDRAWVELLEAGVPVLGSLDVVEADPLDEVLTEFETRRELYPTDQLAVRRTRRAARQALRVARRAS